MELFSKYSSKIVLTAAASSLLTTSRPPSRPEATEHEPEDPIGRPHSRSRTLGREDGELLAEGEVFDQKVGVRRPETSEPTQNDGDSREHRDRMKGCRVGVNDATGHWTGCEI